MVPDSYKKWLLRSAETGRKSSKGSSEALHQGETSHQEAQESLSLPMQGD